MYYKLQSVDTQMQETLENLAMSKKERRARIRLEKQFDRKMRNKMKKYSKEK